MHGRPIHADAGRIQEAAFRWSSLGGASRRVILAVASGPTHVRIASIPGKRQHDRATAAARSNYFPHPKPEITAMPRQRKIDEDLWEDSEEEISSDHVVERFYSQRVRSTRESTPKAHQPGRPKRRPEPSPESDE